jgi:hypothetical protein
LRLRRFDAGVKAFVLDADGVLVCPGQCAALIIWVLERKVLRLPWRPSSLYPPRLMVTC